MFLGTLGASLLGNILAGKRIVRAGFGFTSMFSPYDSKKNEDIFLSYFNNKINLSEQKKFRLMELIETGNYFHQEIN